MCTIMTTNEQNQEEQQQQQQKLCSNCDLMILQGNDSRTMQRIRQQVVKEEEEERRQQQQQQQQQKQSQPQEQVAKIFYVSENFNNKNNNNKIKNNNCHCLNFNNVNKRKHNKQHAPANKNNNIKNKNNFNNYNNNFNHINTNHASSCKARAKAHNSMPATKTSTSTALFYNNMKLHFLVLGIFCATLAPNLTNGSPIRRLGRNLILSKRSLRSPNADMNLSKIQEDIEFALNQTRVSADSLDNLTDNYYLHEFNSTEQELEKLWGWHQLQLKTPFQNPNTTTEKIDLNNLENIKKDLKNIHETLKVLEYMYSTAVQNRSNNSYENRFLKNDTQRVEIDEFFKLSYDFVQMELQNVRKIWGNFVANDQEWIPILLQAEYSRTHPKMHFALSQEHIRIMRIIKSYYTEFLERVKEQLRQ